MENKIAWCSFYFNIQNSVLVEIETSMNYILKESEIKKMDLSDYSGINCSWP